MQSRVKNLSKKRRKTLKKRSQKGKGMIAGKYFPNETEIKSLAKKILKDGKEIYGNRLPFKNPDDYIEHFLVKFNKFAHEKAFPHFKKHLEKNKNLTEEQKEETIEMFEKEKILDFKKKYNDSLF